MERPSSPGTGRRRRTPVRLAGVGALLVVTAAAPAAATPVTDPPAATVAPAGAPAATSILSPRRLPDWIQRSVATARLGTALDAVLARPGVAAPATSCLAVVQGDRTLVADRATVPVIPASNVKLLTATAVLDLLGPTARLTTTVQAARAPVDGVVDGDLFLVGGGDPLLRTPDYVASLNYPEALSTSLPALAAAVRAAGVTRVTGSVVGDESRYDTARSVPGWSPVYAAEGDVGPLSALQVNDGFAAFRPAVVDAPQPAVQAAAVFAGLLAADGVVVAGAPGTGVAPASSVTVTSIASPPLGEVLGAILRPSDDTGSELLTKELGRHAGAGGSTTSGAAAITADLVADHLPTTGLTLLDGSGLDRGDRATCALLAAVIGRGGPTGTLAADLPVAGRSGTLTSRMVGTPAAGRVEAKTGTLDGVSALSGWVLAAPGTAAAAPALAAPLHFAFVLNGPISGATGVAAGDAVAEVLAGWPQALPLASLVPVA